MFQKVVVYRSSTGIIQTPFVTDDYGNHIETRPTNIKHHDLFKNCDLFSSFAIDQGTISSCSSLCRLIQSMFNESKPRGNDLESVGR